MINLIKNELYKIFHKKGIYIVLIITFLFTLLTNYLYTTFVSYDELDDMYESELYYIELLEELEETNTEDYLYSKVNIYIYEFSNSFGKDSWIRTILNREINDYSNELYDLAYQIVSYELGKDTNKENYDLAKIKIEELREKLNKLTEEEYINDLIIKAKNNLENSESNEKALYQAEIATLELRLKYNISYDYNVMNEYLDTYNYNYQQVILYEEKDALKEEEQKYYELAKEELAIAKASIENNLTEEKTDGQYLILTSFYDEYFIMILVIIVLVSGSIVSEEFSKGTIKLLLVKPFTRTKILISKYLTAILMVLFAVLIPFIMQLIVGTLFYGIDSLTTPVIIYNHLTESVEAINIFKNFILITLAILPELILISTLAFTLSTISISTALANTLTIVGVFGSNLINAFAQIYEIDILKYFITLNWDWTVYLFGASSPYKGVTLSLSVIICIIYLLIMLLTSIIVFKKRNIKNV